MLCRACTESFLPVDAAVTCPTCGRRVGKAIQCGGCLARPEQFEQALFGFHFQGAVREAIHAFKFQGRKDVGRTLVGMLEGKLKEVAPAIDVIVPLPLTEKRLRERGFNQSYIISEEASKITGKPIDYRTLVKSRSTEDQITLSRKERKENIRGAFTVKDRTAVRAKKVLLVDDLYTTGSTAREACRTLLRAKAKSVFFFALARTPE